MGIDSRTLRILINHVVYLNICIQSFTFLPHRGYADTLFLSIFCLCQILIVNKNSIFRRIEKKNILLSRLPSQSRKCKKRVSMRENGACTCVNLYYKAYVSTRHRLNIACVWAQGFR